MKFLKLFFILASMNTLFGQSVPELEKRFNTYLNFNGSLNSFVNFNEHSVSILSSGKSEFTVYDDEIAILSGLLKTLKPADFVSIYTWKKNTHLTKKQLDSLLAKQGGFSLPNNSKSISGKRIAIDAGHFAGNMDVARIEQKFIDFSPSPQNGLKDTIRFNEGRLTYQTAHILKHKLEEQGAVVMLTRPQQNYTAFQMTYDDWIAKRKKTVLDSLLKAGAMGAKRHASLMKLSKQKLFWEFFRDYELMERARIVNEFKPDVTVIVHYNVDEKNTDWKNPGPKNYTMTFIGGGMTADNFSKVINKVHFLRLLLSDQLNRSEKLSSLTVNQFSKEMNIPVAQKSNADYLRDNCLKTSSEGVFCRNLALCRTINSPLVYGECLYQDNVKECLNLSREDVEAYGQKSSKRIYQAANCYYNAINAYFSQP
jgi:N-acetylmuramoyl-L-alanine amidase